MADFAGLLENFGKNTEKMVVPDLVKRKAMTKAGAEVLAENCPVPMARVGTRDVFGRSGVPAKLFEIYGLDTKTIVEKAKEVLAKK